MDVDVAPPDCTVNERSTDCRTVPNAPNPMTEEEFFQDETNLMEYWSAAA